MRRPGLRRRLAASLTLILTAPIAGCGADDDSERLLVLAASSLTESFTALATTYEADNPGTRITLSFAGSPTLISQVRNGAPGDVLATADEASLTLLEDQLLAPGVVFARNRLAIVTQPGNPNSIAALADLADPSLTVVLGGQSVPVGAASEQALIEADVEVSPASREPNVKAVLSKVRLGEADAGIVYVTDALAAGADVFTVPLRPVRNSYPIAVLAQAEQPGLGQDFLAFVLSQRGQDVLAGFGFVGAPSAP